MNIQSHNQQKEKLKSHWIIFSLYMIIILSTEPFYREPLFNSSVTFIEYVQGINPNKNPFFQVCEFISMLGSPSIFIPITVMFYNFSNIYKTYTLLMVIFISTLEISILKMIYISPRPYMMSDKIVPFGCEGGWGNPSGHSIFSAAFYLTLWHITFESSQLKNKKTAKYTSLGFAIFIILSVMFSRVFVGAHSLNQIFFGGALGLGIYFFLFYVLCIKVNDGKQLARFMEFKNIIYGVVNFFIFIFAFLLFYYNQNSDNNEKWDTRINSHGCKDVKPNFRLNNEGLLTFGVFLGNLGAFVGLKLEYYITFGENLQNWIQYNFEIEEKSDDESLMTKISINKETQWNHTNSFFSILRLVAIGLLTLLFCFPFYFIDSNDNIYVVFIFKIVTPVNIVTFTMFFLTKLILKSLRMVNMTLFSMLQDSI